MNTAIKDIICEARVNSNELSINVIEDIKLCGLYLGWVRKATNIRLHIQNEVFACLKLTIEFKLIFAKIRVNF